MNWIIMSTQCEEEKIMMNWIPDLSGSACQTLLPDVYNFPFLYTCGAAPIMKSSQNNKTRRNAIHRKNPQSCGEE